MTKEKPFPKPEHPPLKKPTDEDDEYIRQVIEEGCVQKGGAEEEVIEEGIDPEELMGGLGPKGRARAAEIERKRKLR